jgi:hypothetical protein
MFTPQTLEPMIAPGLNEAATQIPATQNPATEYPSAPPSAETLQFRKAEIPAEAGVRTCAVCRQPVEGEYYQINGANACAACAQQRLAGQQRRGGWPEFSRAALFGLGGAFGGALLFALVSYATHMTFSLLSIVVGVMVGKAVLLGSRGCRSRRYQVLAVLLTYGAITTSYIPDLVSEFKQYQAKAKKGSVASAAAPAPTTAKRFGVVGIAVLLVFLIAVSLAAPFLMLASGAGFFNLIIIGIGLFQAWKLTKPDRAKVMGPYPSSEPA